ncbi:hypothetical protein BSL78_24187 [Apostichopus japonicus]|uniref:Uncharacterized protein n=1 Tax=Stichopus japonicus TaxID=307972 RepID=A0A2G8JT86_STIJA|nr:hypothetical protein BSL78_24187 [Apostichopus japonicus]
MDLKVAYIILLLSFIEPSFVDTLACSKMCSGVSNNGLSCYVQSTGCDVVFPTRVFYVADPGYYWVFMNFTTNLRSSSSNISSELRGRFWYRDEYLIQRYTFRIDHIIRDNHKNQVSVELGFVIRNTSAQDSGFYDVVLKEGSNMNASTVVLRQTYRLFNTHSPSPTPACSAVDTASLPLDVNVDYLLNCSVLGYFYPKIEVKIVSSSGECPYQIINKTKASLLPEMTLEHAYVTYCENTSFTCVVSQNWVTYDNEVNSCAFQMERPKRSTTIPQDTRLSPEDSDTSITMETETSKPRPFNIIIYIMENLQYVLGAAVIMTLCLLLVIAVYCYIVRQKYSPYEQNGTSTQDRSHGDVTIQNPGYGYAAAPHRNQLVSMREVHRGRAVDQKASEEIYSLVTK